GGVQRRARPPARGVPGGRRGAEAGAGRRRRRPGRRRADPRLGHRAHRRGDPARAQLLLDRRHRRATRRRLPVRGAGAHARALGVLVLAMATFGLIVAHTWQHARVAAAEREQRRITQELVAIQGPYADVTRIEQQKQELREKLRVIAELEARKVGPVRLLEDLSGATPDKLWLLEFADTGGAVKISGLGVDEQTVADFLRRLASSPYFRRIDLEET